jgi:hypothetical protein
MFTPMQNHDEQHIDAVGYVLRGVRSETFQLFHLWQSGGRHWVTASHPVYQSPSVGNHSRSDNLEMEHEDYPGRLVEQYSDILRYAGAR